MSVEGLQEIARIFYIAACVLAGISFLLFFQFQIWKIIGDLSGRNEKRGVHTIIKQESAILFFVVWSWVFFPISVDAKDVVDVAAPSAVIDFEDEAICVVGNRGYFNTERKAKITIIDCEKMFDEEAAMQGIKISRTNAKGELLPVSKKDIVLGEWVHEGKIHTVEILFGEDGNYTWEISYTNLGGKALEKISTGKSETPFIFTIDREAPFGTIIAVSKEGAKAEYKLFPDMVKQSVCSREKITISGVFEDYIGAVPVKTSYYKENVSAAETGKCFLRKEELDEVSNWKEFDTLDIMKDQSSVVYLKLEDLSGNYCYINTGVLTIDKQKPIMNEFAAKIDSGTNNVNGIFNGDVPISVYVTDPMVGSTYSGIQLISYKVYNMGVETQSGILYERSETGTREAIQTWKGRFVIDSQRNNSNDVVVFVTVQDIAGNTTTENISLKIDISRPIIHITYDNNDVKNNSYFSDDRTATIVIQERNFRPEDVLVQITNSETIVTRQLRWNKIIDSDNLDNTSWATQISYVEEGDYTFDIAYSDLAGNQNAGIDYGSSASPVQFTIDKTLPEVKVSYDNKDANLENYYDDIRTATIEILEHNLDVKDIHVILETKNDEVELTVPKVSEFRRKGDCYIADISYLNDGGYVFDIEVFDKAGNKSVEYEKEIFFVDTVFPRVQIKGVFDKSSNRKDVCVEIVCIDENYLEEQIEIKWLHYDGEEADIRCEAETLEHGVCFKYENLPIELHMDDHYKLQVVMTDKAGNCTEKTVQFSVNRFGSSFQLSEETQEINHSYIKCPVDLIIEERNVDLLENSKIILFKNGETVLLQADKDYKVDWEREKSGKYQYIYTIFKENFEENGVYQVSISSEDVAGNISYNDIGDTDSEIRFGIDTIKPVLSVYNLKSGKVYETDLWTVNMFVRDNFRLSKVEVYLDDEKYQTWTRQELEKIEEKKEELYFDIAGDSMFAHHVKIVCVDEAGNEYIEEIAGFYITTNPWIHFWKYKFLICGIFAGVILASAIFLRIIHKKRSNPLSDLEK